MEQQLAFLKKHGFVIAGVGLPLLVILAFVVARMLPVYLVADPRYDLVYASTGDYQDGMRDRTCELAPVEGRLRVRWTLAKEPVYWQTQRVFRLNPASGDVVELEVPAALDLEAQGGSQEFFLEGLEDVRVEPALRAPDGYEYEIAYSGGGGLFGEIFYHGPRGARSVIHKSGRRIEVPRPGHDPYSYASLRFIGWAIPKDEPR